MEDRPAIKMGRDKVYRKLKLTLGVKPVSGEIILLPVWTLKVRHKEKRGKRKITMDAATGRILSGKF
jgi:hypothetical protein